MSGDLVLDAVLCLLLVGTATAAVLVADALDSAIFFGTLSLVMAVAWLRLGAPDLALVEAVLELIMILLIGTLGLVRAISREPGEESARDLRAGRRRTLVLALPLMAAFAVAVILAGVAGGEPGIAPLVRAEIEASGVENPVTAVLLNFRALDTLLEISVLLLAVIGVLFLQPHARVEPESRLLDLSRHGMPALRWFAARVAPVGVLFTVFLWHVGASKAGGAFQAGAMFAGMLGVLFMTHLVPTPDPERWWIRAVPAAGVVVFAGVGSAMLAFGNVFLEYPPELAHALIIAVEGVMMISIGACLGGLVTDISRRARRT